MSKCTQRRNKIQKLFYLNGFLNNDCPKKHQNTAFTLDDPLNSYLFVSLKPLITNLALNFSSPFSVFFLLNIHLESIKLVFFPHISLAGRSTISQNSFSVIDYNSSFIAINHLSLSFDSEASL